MINYLDYGRMIDKNTPKMQLKELSGAFADWIGGFDRNQA